MEIHKKHRLLQMCLLIGFIASLVKGEKNTNSDLSLEEGMKEALPYYNKDKFYDFTQNALGSDIKSLQNKSEGAIDKENIYILVKALQNKKVIQSFAFGTKIACNKTMHEETYRDVYLNYIKDSKYLSKQKTIMDNMEENFKAQISIETIVLKASSGINFYSYLFIVCTCLTLILMILSFILNLKLFSYYNRVRDVEENKSLESTDLESNHNILVPVQSQDGTLKQLVDGFNPVKNIKALFKASDSSTNELAFLDGIRVLAGLKVVFTHVKQNYNNSYASNFQPINDNLNWMIIDFRGDLTFAVDVFFFLGAFLATMSLVRSFTSEGFTIKTLSKAYLNRFLRLFYPIFAIRISEYGFSNYIFYHFRWYDHFISPEVRKYWLFNPLTVKVPFFDFEFKTKIDANWYFFNDFDYFMILAFVVKIYIYRKAYGYLTCIAIILCGISLNLLNYVNIYKVSNQYMNGALRAGPYFIGTLFGFGYHEFSLGRKRNQTKDGKTSPNCQELKGKDAILGHLIHKLQTLTSGTKRAVEVACFTTLFILWTIQAKNPMKNVMRHFYILALGLICILLIINRLKWINQILSHSIFTVGSKLTLMVFIFHVKYKNFLINYHYESSDPSYSSFFYLYTRLMLICIMVSIPMTILFEIPYININSRLLFKRKSIRESENTQIREYQPVRSKKII